MSESLSTPEPSVCPCTLCGTALSDEVRFCFECGAAVVPELDLPSAPAGAREELRTPAFSSVRIRPVEDDVGLEPGKAIEIESLAFKAVLDESPIEFEDDEDDTRDDVEAPQETEDSERVANPSGTVVAMAPDRPLPFWPAPPRGDTVLAPPPTAPAGMA